MFYLLRLLCTIRCRRVPTSLLLLGLNRDLKTLINDSILFIVQGATNQDVGEEAHKGKEKLPFLRKSLPLYKYNWQIIFFCRFNHWSFSKAEFRKCFKNYRKLFRIIIISGLDSSFSPKL